MAIATLKELIENGVHYGCQASRWNPAMKPYIHSRKGNVHIIDLKKTLQGLIQTVYFLRQTAAQGKRVLFVGTRKQTADIVREEAERSHSFFVAGRWLGGTLTNMGTMRQRITRLEELEALDTSGSIQQFSKKMVSTLSRERRKIARNFEGTREMKDLPGALVVVDPSHEAIGVAEAVKVDIPVIGICDTDCDPKFADFVIPGNDDSASSLRYLLRVLGDAILKGAQDGSIKAAARGGDRVGSVQSKGKAPEAAEAEAAIEVPKDIEKHGSFSYGGDEGGENAEG